MGVSPAGYTGAIEKYLGSPVDIVIYNNKIPDAKVLNRYAREKALRRMTRAICVSTGQSTTRIRSVRMARLPLSTSGTWNFSARRASPANWSRRSGSLNDR